LFVLVACNNAKIYVIISLFALLHIFSCVCHIAVCAVLLCGLNIIHYRPSVHWGCWLGDRN